MRKAQVGRLLTGMLVLALTACMPSPAQLRDRFYSKTAVFDELQRRLMHEDADILRVDSDGIGMTGVLGPQSADSRNAFYQQSLQVLDAKAIVSDPQDSHAFAVIAAGSPFSKTRIAGWKYWPNGPPPAEIVTDRDAFARTLRTGGGKRVAYQRLRSDWYLYVVGADS